MKTRYIFSIILLSLTVFFFSCSNVNQKGLKKFHGNWTIEKIEYYDISSGNYVLKTTTNDAGYFLLYDQMYDEQENDCAYQIDSTAASFMATALGNSRYCLWYVPSKNQIDFAGVPSGTASVTVNKKGNNKMEWIYKGDSYKEVYYLKRIDV
jgi:hypothetical protein